MSKRSDTIAAICTPCGRSGIGIIRISGNNALSIIEKITSNKNPWYFLSNNTRKLIHTYLLDNDKIEMDEILYSIMPPGRSYTGELTVEINCHGGISLLNAALDLVIKNGARLANPGEFTRRAVENGRMDIVQAEAINDLIMARTTMERKIAWRQFNGGLSEIFKEIRSKLVNMISQSSYVIDFDDIGSEEHEKNIFLCSLNDIRSKISGLISVSNNSRIFKQGYWVVLTGPPNSGKSTIFNAILNTNRAIVSEVPGTTRDYIIESMMIDGIEVKIIDTAGIRETSNELEKISIERSRFQIDKSDLILFVIDKSKKMSDDEEKFANKVLVDEGLVIFNKIDLKAESSTEDFYKKNINNCILDVSAKSGKNMDLLIGKIKEKMMQNISISENPIITSERQMNLLSASYDSLDRILSLNIERNLDLINYELHNAINKIDEIFCENSEEEIKDNIFKNFCVGK